MNDRFRFLGRIRFQPIELLKPPTTLNTAKRRRRSDLLGPDDMRDDMHSAKWEPRDENRGGKLRIGIATKLRESSKKGRQWGVKRGLLNDDRWESSGRGKRRNGKEREVKVGYRLLNVIYGNLNLCSIARWKSPN